MRGNREDRVPIPILNSNTHSNNKDHHIIDQTGFEWQHVSEHTRGSCCCDGKTGFLPHDGDRGAVLQVPRALRRTSEGVSHLPSMQWMPCIRIVCYTLYRIFDACWISDVHDFLLIPMHVMSWCIHVRTHWHKHRHTHSYVHIHRYLPLHTPTHAP